MPKEFPKTKILIVSIDHWELGDCFSASTGEVITFSPHGGSFGAASQLAVLQESCFLRIRRGAKIRKVLFETLPSDTCFMRLHKVIEIT